MMVIQAKANQIELEYMVQTQSGETLNPSLGISKKFRILIAERTNLAYGGYILNPEAEGDSKFGGDLDTSRKDYSSQREKTQT